jgi:hypothetical protein
MRRIAMAALMSALIVAGAEAQQTEGGPDPAKVRLRIGPLMLNPAVALTSLGVDDNVFNEETNPKRDFTFTLTPRTDLWMPVARTWIKGSINEDLVWYQKYSSERSGNTTYAIGWTVPLSRLSATVSAGRANTRERPTPEIDERAPRKETTYRGLVSYRVLAATSLGVTASRTDVRFDPTAVFLNVSLQDALSRTTTTTGVTLSQLLTPLTTVSVEVARERVAFTNSPERDTRSSLVTTRVAFDPVALLKGSASFGWRRFDPVAGDVPGYRGTTASGELTYAGTGSSRITTRLFRDIQYSYDVLQPYYLQTGISLDVMQQIFGPLDVAVRWGATRLEYRDRVDASAAATNRTDHVRTVGGGLGYHLGTDVRFGINVDHTNRRSPVTGRGYDGFRAGTAITYLY